MNRPFALALLLLLVSCTSLRSSQIRAVDHYNWANALLDDKKLEEALETYQLALEEDSSLAAASYNMSLILAEMGEYRRSLEILFELRKRDPENLKVLNAIGEVYLESGDIRSAQTYFGMVLDVSPAHELSIAGMARSFERSDRFSKAEEQWLKLVEMDSSEEENIVNLAYSLRKQGQFQLAVARYAQAFLYGSSNVDAVLGAAGSAMDMGDASLALHYIKAGLQGRVSDKSEIWWYASGLYILELDNHAEGIAAFREALNSGYSDKEALDDFLTRVPQEMKPVLARIQVEAAESALKEKIKSRKLFKTPPEF